MKQLYQYAKPFRNTLILAVFLKAFSTLAELFIPYLMSHVIDRGIKNKDIPLIIALCAGMLVITIISFVTTAWGHALAAKGSQSIGESLRNILFSHIQQLTLYDVEHVSTASLITRVTNDVEHIQRTILMTCRMMVRAPLIVVGGTVMSLLLDPYLTAVMFGGMVLLFAVSILSYKLTRPIHRKVKANLDKMTGILRENLSGIRVIKAFAKMEEEVERLDQQSRKVKSYELKAGKINAYMGPSVGLIVNLTIIMILYVSGLRVNGGTLEIGKVITILNYINMVLGAMMAIPRMFMMFSHASTSAKRINEVLDIKDFTRYGVGKLPKDKEKMLVLDEVSFKYPRAQHYALKAISFTLLKGQTMAVVGATGAGKTSLLYLILRLYEATSGEITFQGRNIKDYDKPFLTEKITAAMQQYNIFSMSIKDNIILDKMYDKNKLEKAVETAQIRDLLEELEAHFDHKVSQNGSNLSGGQKQRMSVARTLYRESDLIILDDVSSALDYKTDLKLRRALRKSDENQTVILISQRISSVKNADNILVLEQGECVGFGTHEALLKSCEIYRQICASQSQGGLDAL